MTVERLTSEQYEEDDLSGIPDLVEVIKLQGSGPAEAARALRKKLKYGNVHRQLRALVLLDGLIQNAGPRFQRTFVDEPLLERLRVCGTSDLSDPDVKKKCSELFRSWASEYKNTPGLERVAVLYKVNYRQNHQGCYLLTASRNFHGVNRSLRKTGPRSCGRRSRIRSETPRMRRKRLKVPLRRLRRPRDRRTRSRSPPKRYSLSATQNRLQAPVLSFPARPRTRTRRRKARSRRSLSRSI